MGSFEWHNPDWWQRVAPGTIRDAVDVMGLVCSLDAARPETLFDFINGQDVSDTDLPDRAFAAWPLNADDVRGFLKGADALTSPENAASRMTGRLIALEGQMNAATLGLNIIDVWRRCHDLMPADRDHGDHCACLMNCRRMPRGIRAVDEALQTYYEQHHQQPYPECFGSSDESFLRTLRPMIRHCLDAQ